MLIFPRNTESYRSNHTPECGVWFTPRQRPPPRPRPRDRATAPLKPRRNLPRFYPRFYSRGRGFTVLEFQTATATAAVTKTAQKDEKLNLTFESKTPSTKSQF